MFKQTTDVRRGERGAAAVELALTLPLFVLGMVFLIGMGHTLITRQHGLVAARFAAFYHAARGSRPGAALVSQTVAGRTEQWRLSHSSQSASGGSFGGAGGIVESVFGSFVGGQRGEGVLSYRADTTPRRGLLPRVYNLRDATGSYHLANKTWKCERGRGSYLSLLTSSIPLPGFPNDLACCKTYGGQNRSQ